MSTIRSRSGAGPVRHRQARLRPSAAESGWEAGADPRRRRQASARGARGRDGARNALATNRERMVDIGRGNQQAGRQGQ